MVGLNSGERIAVAGILGCRNINTVIRYAGHLVSGGQRPGYGCVRVVEIGSRAGLRGDADRRVCRNANRKRLILPLRIQDAGRGGIARADQNTLVRRVAGSAAIRLRVPTGKQLAGIEEWVALNHMHRVVRHARNNGHSAAGQRTAVSVVGDVDEHRRRAPLRGQGGIRCHGNGAVRVIEVPVHTGTPAEEAHALRRGHRCGIIRLYLRLRAGAIGVAVHGRGAGCRSKVIGQRVSKTADPFRIENDVLVDPHARVKQNQRAALEDEPTAEDIRRVRLIRNRCRFRRGERSGADGSAIFNVAEVYGLSAARTKGDGVRNAREARSLPNAVDDQVI